MTSFKRDIRSSIIKSGKAEFLRTGYEKASLRTICQKAGVTTGAFYSNFRSKENLLDVIIGDELGASEWELQFACPPEALDAESVARVEAAFVSYALEHRDACLLLLDCAAGSPYEGYRDKIARLFDELIAGYVKNEGLAVRDETAHLVAVGEFHRCCQVIRAGYESDLLQAIQSDLREFTVGGLDRLRDNSALYRDGKSVIGQ